MGETISVHLDPRDPAILADCATIHVEAIPNGFLPTFGSYFLRHLYDFIASSEKSFLVVAREDGSTLGFICGSFGAGSLYKSFAIRKLALVGVPMFLRLFRKGALKKVWEVVRYPTGEEHEGLPGSEILNFCVSGSSQGKGVGSRLFAESERQYRERGIPEIRIVTGSEQLSAQKFYERRGAELVGTLEVHDGHESRMYVYKIPESEGAK